MYIYRIKFNIFGKQMTAKVAAENSTKACEKFALTLLQKLNFEDVAIHDQQTGAEVDVKEYAKQSADMIKQIKAMRPSFSLN